MFWNATLLPVKFLRTRLVILPSQSKIMDGFSTILFLTLLEYQEICYTSIIIIINFKEFFSHSTKNCISISNIITSLSEFILAQVLEPLLRLSGCNLALTTELVNLRTFLNQSTGTRIHITLQYIIIHNTLKYRYNTYYTSYRKLAVSVIRTRPLHSSGDDLSYVVV